MKPADSRSVAVGIICKTPFPGTSKTRLSPPLRPDECAEISACFISDLAATIEILSGRLNVDGYAVYTPIGSEERLRHLLPPGFQLMAQGNGDLGDRLNKGINDLLARAYAGAILVNADSPTLPRSILEGAIAAVREGDKMVLSPAVDGGYIFVGLSRPHPQVFAGIPWSTGGVFGVTLERAREIGLDTVVLDRWYDVDDASSYAMLEAELSGRRPDFSDPAQSLQPAPKTRQFIMHRRSRGVP